MKIWLGLKWAYQALLAGLHKLYDMILTGTFYLVAESERLWIGVNPETVSLDANNIQAAPLQVRFWAGEGSNKVAMPAYLTFRVESVVSSSVTKLFEDKPEVKVSSYDYTIPSDQYATANRISIYAYEDAGRTKEIDSKQVNIVAANPTPFPRPEDWNVANVYKNGEYLKQDNVLYMWTSRVSGNTEISPKEWIEAHQESGLWTPYPYDKLIAAEIALLNFALIGSAVFQDEYMFSQQGVDASGNPNNDFRKFGTANFIPNLLFDFQTGSFKGRNVEVEGTIIANASFVRMHDFRANGGYFFLNPAFGSEFRNGRPNRNSQSTYMLPEAVQYNGMKISLIIYNTVWGSTYGYTSVVTTDGFNELTFENNEYHYCNKIAISKSGVYEFMSLGAIWILTKGTDVSYSYVELLDRTYEDPIN